MRKELQEYMEQNPHPRHIRAFLFVVEFIFIMIWKIRFRFLKVGSPRWHITQEKFSRKSCVGKDMKARNLFYMKTLNNCGDKLYVHPNVYFSYPQNIKIGYNLFINRGVFITAPVSITIGDNVLIGPNVVINSGSHYYKNARRLIRDQGHKLLPIIIEDDVWIGANATILPGVILKKGLVVAANAVVTKTFEPYSVVAGVPAKLIKERVAYTLSDD